MSPVAAARLEHIQTEAAADTDHTGPSSLVEQLANLPLDMKAVGVAVGAFAVTSAYQRIYKELRFRAEADRAVGMIRTADAYVPETPRQTFARRALGRTRRVLVTAAASCVAYKAGEHMPAGTDLVVQSSLLAVAGLGFAASKIRAMRYSARGPNH
jgi:hypothetical protein